MWHKGLVLFAAASFSAHRLRTAVLIFAFLQRQEDLKGDLKVLENGSCLYFSITGIVLLLPRLFLSHVVVVWHVFSGAQGSASAQWSCSWHIIPSLLLASWRAVHVSGGKTSSWSAHGDHCRGRHHGRILGSVVGVGWNSAGMGGSDGRVYYGMSSVSMSSRE